MKRVPIMKRGDEIAGYALVSDEDFEWAIQQRWYFDSDGYARRAFRHNGKTRTRSMHRDILGLEIGNPLVADHRNGIRTDNRRENLQAVTVLENNQRRGSRAVATSRFRGVHRLKSNGKWQASIRYRGRLLHLGTWDTEEEAGEIAAAVRGALMPYSEEASPCAA